MAPKRSSLLANPFIWAVAIRLIYYWVLPRVLQGDASDFEQIARSVATGHGFSRCGQEPWPPTAQRPPLFPLLLGVSYWLGFSQAWGSAALNLMFDLASMRVARAWGESLKLAWAPRIPWIIAFFPLLITYGTYPTTENLSVLLFFGAALAVVRVQPLLGGLCWGLLALCRSYYLLFPFLLILIRPSKQWSRPALALMAAASLVAPAFWVARNQQAFGRPVFSQSGMVGYQAYLGIAVPGFDWWRPDHAQLVLSSPEFKRIIGSHCVDESLLYAWDRDIQDMTVDYVVENPGTALRNVVLKTFNLFTNWGIFMPYNRVPYLLVQFINAAVAVYWIWALRLLWRRRRGSPGLESAIRFSWLNIAYVAAVTLPFAVDARYLLAPFLTLLIAVLEIEGRPKASR